MQCIQYCPSCHTEDTSSLLQSHALYNTQLSFYIFTSVQLSLSWITEEIVNMSFCFILFFLILFSLASGMQASIFWAGRQAWKYGCRRKGIWHRNTLDCMAGLAATLIALICVAAGGQLVVIQWEALVRQDQ